jgi:hypothetical protein
MAKVYVTQENNNVDYLPACKFGDLVFITGSNHRVSHHPQSLNTKETLDKIIYTLEHFNSDEDYLLCTGSPVIMAICGSVLGNRLRKVLNWDNRAYQYNEVIL